MTELSPQAQAVKDAAWAAFWSDEAMAPNDAEIIAAAAALRAVANQIIEEVSPVESLLAIAAELEGSNA